MTRKRVRQVLQAMTIAIPLGVFMFQSSTGGEPLPKPVGAALTLVWVCGMIWYVASGEVSEIT